MKRNYGVDLLRILSMLMVCTLHVLGQGGILKAAAGAPVKSDIVWFLEIAAYCAVNCYALISGYVGVEAKFKYSSIIRLWLQVAFYTVGITVVFRMISPDLAGKKELFAAVTPVLSKQYWYFTAYFCIFFFIPFFNKMVNLLSQRQRTVLMVTIILLFSVLPLFRGKDIFGTGKGYSALWLALLYVMGACIRKNKDVAGIHAGAAILLYMLSVMMAWIARGRFVSYTSPAILAAAIFLLLGLSGIHLQEWMNKGIAVISPLVFSVYIIHVHPLVWEYVMKGRFAVYVDYGIVKMVSAILLTVGAIFCSSVIVDAVRRQIFKWLRLDWLCRMMDFKIEKYISF